MGTAKTEVIHARIDSTLKARAEAIFETLGLNASDAIRLFYAQVTLANGLPFPVKIPNAETREAIQDAEAGNLKRYGSSQEMFDELGL
ncbi:type II toxin-antitoxin system RelB/DinJ family antitoxin [Isosphaeraceae bacterium EP7]